MNPNFTTVTVSVRRDLAAKLHKMFPHYGAVSKVMSSLIQQLVDGRLKIK